MCPTYRFIGQISPFLAKMTYKCGTGVDSVPMTTRLLAFGLEYNAGVCRGRWARASENVRYCSVMSVAC